MDAVDKWELAGKDVWAWRRGAGPVGRAVIVLQGEGFQPLSGVERLLQGHEGAFALLGFGPIDWNRDLTPWPAPGLRGDGDFGGGGGALLRWMLDNLVPAIGALYPGADIYLAGYSLGGLMALWCLYQSTAFAGCACCSGSLWYDGWEQYAAGRLFARPVRVYLSLGEGEERAKDGRLSRVGACTRHMAERVAAQPNTRSTLRWHPGGHFNDPAGRLAQGIAWLLVN